MNIGLVDVDGHNFPNFALMRLSAYNKAKGHQVKWVEPAGRYDKVLASKVFTFTPDYDYRLLDAREVIRGGTQASRSCGEQPDDGLFHLPRIPFFAPVLFKRLHPQVSFLPRP